MEIPTEQAVDGSQNVGLQIYTDIRSHLIVGNLLPGDTLSIRTLAAERGTGTMPVREALKQLAMEKALTGAAKKAYRVPDLSRRQVSNLFQIRAALEGVASEMATPNVTAEDIASLRKFVAAMDLAWPIADAPGFLDAHFRFHSLIYWRAGNEDLFDLIINIFVRSGPWLAQGILDLDNVSGWSGEHDAIITALEARNPARVRGLVEKDAGWGADLFRT